MGVFTLRVLVYSQLILLSLVLNKKTDAQNISESRVNITTAPPLNATGNHTENNASNSSSNSAYNNTTTTENNLTTPMTPFVSKTSTSGPTQSNYTVTASAEHPNTTQSVTSSTTNINSTAVTSTNSTEKATSSTKPETKQTTTTYIVQNSTISLIEPPGLTHSEQFLTIFFSVLLGLIVLVSLAHFVYKLSKSKERSIQYTHRRLQNEESGEPFGVQDDTLVISGGLYDGPQIYNPTMTVQNEEEFQTDSYGYASRPTQFRLEFLREDQDQALEQETSTFQTFQAHDQES